MKISRARFREALRNCKMKEEQIRRKKLLDNLENKNFKCFWNEVYEIKNNSDGKAPNIDGETDPAAISNIFSQKYKKIFANQKSQPYVNNFKEEE